MATYLVQTKFTAEGAAAVVNQGFGARADQFRGFITEVGGSCESYHFSDGGEFDVFAIVTWPDDYGPRGARQLMQALSSGAIANARLYRLYEGSELDDAPDLNWTAPDS